MQKRSTICDLHAQWPERVAATAESPSECTRERARHLRQNMSLPEAKLWQRLRARKLNGLRFRRQHVIGPYAVDFYCHEVRLVVEVDGHAAHADRGARDDARDEWMRKHALDVLRLSAKLVLDDIGRALTLVAAAAEERKAELPARNGGVRHPIETQSKNS